jgi:hypothetical protein
MPRRPRPSQAASSASSLSSVRLRSACQALPGCAAARRSPRVVRAPGRQIDALFRLFSFFEASCFSDFFSILFCAGVTAALQRMIRRRSSVAAYTGPVPGQPSATSESAAAPVRSHPHPPSAWPTPPTHAPTPARIGTRPRSHTHTHLHPPTLPHTHTPASARPPHPPAHLHAHLHPPAPPARPLARTPASAHRRADPPASCRARLY